MKRREFILIPAKALEWFGVVFAGGRADSRRR